MIELWASLTLRTSILGAPENRRNKSGSAVPELNAHKASLEVRASPVLEPGRREVSARLTTAETSQLQTRRARRTQPTAQRYNLTPRWFIVADSAKPAESASSCI